MQRDQRITVAGRRDAHDGWLALKTKPNYQDQKNNSVKHVDTDGPQTELRKDAWIPVNKGRILGLQ